MTSRTDLDIRSIQAPAAWAALVAFTCLIAVLSIGTHDVAISHLGFAYPTEDAVPSWARYVGQVVRLVAMVSLCRLSRWRLDRFGTFLAAIIVGLLMVFLYETLRAIVVDNIVSDGWVDRRWIFLLMMRLPNALQTFCNGAVALVIERALRRHPSGWTVAAALIAAAFGAFILLPGLKGAAAWVDATLHLAETTEVYQPPYGFYVYKFIYGMFLEPTLASLVLVTLVWPSLRGSTLRRVCAFTLLLLLVRGRIVGTFLFSLWLKLSWPMAFGAEGQFLAETLVMAALTNLAWAKLSKPVSAAAA